MSTAFSEMLKEISKYEVTRLSVSRAGLLLIRLKPLITGRRSVFIYADTTTNIFYTQGKVRGSIKCPLSYTTLSKKLAECVCPLF